MAARKKAKGGSRTKGRKAPAKKKASRKKPAAKPAARKAPARRAPARPRRSAVRPAARPMPAGPIVKPPPGLRVGVVTHYFSELSVAVVKLDSGMLRVGDNIHIRGHTRSEERRVGKEYNKEKSQ